jgi:hypothetical protein
MVLDAAGMTCAFHSGLGPSTCHPGLRAGVHALVLARQTLIPGSRIGVRDDKRRWIPDRSPG